MCVCTHSPTYTLMENLVLSTSAPAHLTFQSTGEAQKHGRDGVCFTDGMRLSNTHWDGRVKDQAGQTESGGKGLDLGKWRVEMTEVPSNGSVW